MGYVRKFCQHRLFIALLFQICFQPELELEITWPNSGNPLAHFILKIISI